MKTLISILLLFLLFGASNSYGQPKKDASACDSTVFITKSFSPNADTYNDCFMISFGERKPAGYSLGIFNRWGEKIFESADPKDCWNGQYKEAGCAMGVYFWVLKFHYPGEEEKTCSGDVTLIR